MWPATNLVNKKECLWSWGSPRLIGGVPETEGVQNGVSSNFYEGEIQAKKRGERRKKRKMRKEEKQNKERFSRSGWEWSISF